MRITQAGKTSCLRASKQLNIPRGKEGTLLISREIPRHATRQRHHHSTTNPGVSPFDSIFAEAEEMATSVSHKPALPSESQTAHKHQAPIENPAGDRGQFFSKTSSPHASASSCSLRAQVHASEYESYDPKLIGTATAPPSQQRQPPIALTLSTPSRAPRILNCAAYGVISIARCKYSAVGHRSRPLTARKTPST